MKKLILVLIVTVSFILQDIPANAQQGYNWFFGNLAAISFDTGTPVAFTGSAMNTIEGCASISDTTGNVLFYTDGSSVWNRNNVVMPNGSGLLGAFNSTQSGVIVPYPENHNLYYVFTVPDLMDPAGLRYSMVDMTLDGGNGDVTTQKNIPLLTPASEKITAVVAANGIDMWVVTHDANDTFYTWKITTAGLESLPVKSAAGTSVGMNPENCIGYLKVSPDGHHLAQAVWFSSYAEVLDFDNVTGIVSHPITLINIPHAYGIEFSPKGDKLYVADNEIAPGSLWQFDLTVGSDSLISASRVLVGTTIPPLYFAALQVGPDRKIYVAIPNSGYLGSISNPDSAAALVSFNDSAVFLNGSICEYGLPTMVQSYFSVPAEGTNDFSSANSFSLYPNPANDKLIITHSSPLNGVRELPFDNGQFTINAIAIYDVTGRIIYQEQAHSQLSIIHCQLFSSGIYFVQVYMNDGSVEVRKFVKE